MPDPKDERLETYWEDVRGTPVPDHPSFESHPGELVIGMSPDRILVRIQPDGQLRYGEGYTPDETAEVFWITLATKRRGMEERLMHLGLMEQLLIRVGRADLHAERARMRAVQESATADDHFRAEMAVRNLEVLVHQMIEFSRGLAQRPTEAQPIEETGDSVVRIPEEPTSEG